MSFNPQYKYFNKCFVVGTVTEIQNQQRQDESSYGVQFVVNAGSPSGFARVRLINNKNVPDAYNYALSEFSGGTPRLAFGLGQDWLRLGERESNKGRTFRDFTQFASPRLALQSEQDRVAGKLIGTLTSKQVVDDHYVIVLEVYETNKDGSVRLTKEGDEDVIHFTLTARGEQANEIHTTPEGSNVECSVRLINDVIKDDFGDIVDSISEANVEKFKVLIAASGLPSFAVGGVVPSFGTQQPTAPTFGTQTPASVFPAQPTTAPTPTGAPFGGAPLPFPNAGGGQVAPFGGFPGSQG